jgi:uncharacterized membrane protein YhaH (DUF805 family)
MLVGLLLVAILGLVITIQIRRMRARKDSDWENS